MFKITISIEGMKCPKCEAHMDEAVRQALKVEKVTSSHEKKETVLIAEEDITEEKLRAVVAGAGYEMLGFTKEPYEKKGVFGLFKK